MASPAELGQGLPETLPEDFSEWDGEASPAVAPGKSGGPESTHADVETPNQSEQAAFLESLLESPADKQREDRSPAPGPVFLKQQKPSGASVPNRGALWLEPGPSKTKVPIAPAVNRPADGRSTSSVPVFIKQQESTDASKTSEKSAERNTKAPRDERSNEARTPTSASLLFKQLDLIEDKKSSAQIAVDDEAGDAFDLKLTGGFETDDGVFHSLRSKIDNAEGPNKKKWMIIAAAGCSVVLLLVLMFTLYGPRHKSMAKQLVPPVPATTASQFTVNTPQQLPAEEEASSKPQAGTAIEPVTANQSTYEQTAPKVPQVQSKMMDDQLTAPTRITKDIKNQFAEDAPPPSGFNTASTDGLGGNGVNNSVFSGRSQPVVARARPVSISAGVATGMLIQKTTPVYPMIAKTARVAGTVVMQATISKTGAITNLSVVSGPPMLRQSAFEAVRTWRYKPYQLNNEPTEVETTINVIFSLQ
jgi:TonB family protein